MKFRLIFIFIAIVFTGFSPTQESGSKEYELKAAFIYKFTNYIEWGSQIPGNDFIIGIIGPSPIKKQLIEIANSKKINNKRIIVRQFDKPEEITACHILFIPQKTSRDLNNIILKATNTGTLTISEKAGYAALGTALNFILVNDKLKFEANPKAISAAGLSASSQLLKLAIIVD